MNLLTIAKDCCERGQRMHLISDGRDCRHDKLDAALVKILQPVNASTDVAQCMFCADLPCVQR